MDAEHTPTPAETAAMIQRAYDVAQERAQGGPDNAPPVIVVYDEAAGLLDTPHHDPDAPTATELWEHLRRRLRNELPPLYPVATDGRKSFRSYDTIGDAPDGAVLCYDGDDADPAHPERHGFYQLSGDEWMPVELPPADARLYRWVNAERA